MEANTTGGCWKRSYSRGCRAWWGWEDGDCLEVRLIAVPPWGCIKRLWNRSLPAELSLQPYSKWPRNTIFNYIISRWNEDFFYSQYSTLTPRSQVPSQLIQNILRIKLINIRKPLILWLFELFEIKILSVVPTTCQCPVVTCVGACLLGQHRFGTFLTVFSNLVNTLKCCDLLHN